MNGSQPVGCDPPRGHKIHLRGLDVINGKEKKKKSISICAFLLYLLLKLN